MFGYAVRCCSCSVKQVSRWPSSGYFVTSIILSACQFTMFSRYWIAENANCEVFFDNHALTLDNGRAGQSFNFLWTDVPTGFHNRYRAGWLRIRYQQLLGRRD